MNASVENVALSSADLRVSPRGLLHLLQITSPGLPIGAFAYSHGLERAVENGWVHDVASARTWIEGVLVWSLGACDIPVFSRLYRAFERGDHDDARAWSRWLAATRSTSELGAEDRQLGVALARVLTSLGLTQAKPWLDDRSTTHVALFALAACAWQIPLEAAAMAFLFAWLEAQVSAAVRLVPLGQTDGQRILADLAPIVCDSVGSGLARADADIAGGVVGHATASAQHETQYSRLFRS